MGLLLDVLDDGGGREPQPLILLRGQREVFQEVGFGIRGNLKAFVVFHHTLRLGICEPVAGTTAELIDGLGIELFVVDAQFGRQQNVLLRIP